MRGRMRATDSGLRPSTTRAAVKQACNRGRRRDRLLAVAWVFALATPPGAAWAAGKPVGILVLKEHGVGSAAQAQPYVDRFVAMAAKENSWPGARGQYHTTRSAADAYITKENPHYAILSLGGFLALRKKHTLDVIGQVEVPRAGGQQYHLISKTAKDLAGCKGKRLATDHADDPRFVERVVAGGDFVLADFKLVTTQRPLQAIKKVISDEADCALVDDAQLAELAHIDDSADVKPVWKSAWLPPMMVVALPSAPAAERQAFRSGFTKLCDGEAKDACKEVGIVSLKPAETRDYAAVIAAYGK